MWTGSRDGLNRFDGTEVRVFRPSLNGQPVDPNITSRVFQDLDGFRWFSSNNALHRISPKQDDIESWQFKANDNTYYYAFHLERDSFLWVSAHDSLYIVQVYESNPQKAKPIHALSGFHFIPWLDRKGNVIGLFRPRIREGSGIEILRYRSNGEVKRENYFLSNSQTQTDTSLFNIVIENDTCIWLTSPVGLIKFNPFHPNRKRIYSHLQSEENASYYDLDLWGDRYIWVSSYYDGLFLFDKTAKAFVKHEPFLNVEGNLEEPALVNSLHVDENGIMWLSVYQYGILYRSLLNNKFQELIPPDYLKGQKQSIIWGIGEYPSGDLLVLVARQGLFRLSIDFSSEEKSFKKIYVPCLDGRDINQLSQNSDGTTWLITRTGAVLYEPDLNICSCHIEMPSQPLEIVQISPDSFTAFGDSLIYSFDCRFNNVNVDTLSQKKTYTDFFTAYYQDSINGIGFLMVGENELRVIENTFPYRTISEHLNTGYIYALDSKKRGETWLASSIGLMKYDVANKSLHTIEIAEGRNRSFVDIEIDSFNHIWLASYQGLIRYNPINQIFKTFNKADGLFSIQFEDNVATSIRSNLIVFGGSNGLTAVDPEKFALYKITPKIDIKSMYAGKHFIDYSNNFRYQFPYSQNNLRIHFAAIEFSDPDQNQFRTHLIRNRTDTISTGSNLTVEYPNLREGNYQLHAYAANSDNVWTQDPYIVPFTIRPPWYRTWWARTLGVLLFLALVYGIYRVRVRQIARREAFKRKEAEYKQLVAETETAVLRLQMNPHFLFNSMNSINAYILQRDVDKASEYLNHFARLMRRILELSEHPLITVDEEMELLEQYLTAEAMRMSQPMTYSFEIDPDLDPDEVLLPTMLLQPFVENAIWHGLSPKDGGGHITIGFRQKGQTLECSVEDNGVGRARTESKHKTHRSKALEITRKRLNVLAEQEQAKTELQILDLTHPDGSPAGTRVMVTLPVL